MLMMKDIFDSIDIYFEILRKTSLSMVEKPELLPLPYHVLSAVSGSKILLPSRRNILHWTTQPKRRPKNKIFTCSFNPEVVLSYCDSLKSQEHWFCSLLWSIFIELLLRQRVIFRCFFCHFFPYYELRLKALCHEIQPNWDVTKCPWN